MSSRKLCGTLVETPLAAKSTLVRGAADLVVRWVSSLSGDTGRDDDAAASAPLDPEPFSTDSQTHDGFDVNACAVDQRKTARLIIEDQC
jgi:hypothetical protein